MCDVAAVRVAACGADDGAPSRFECLARARCFDSLRVFLDDARADSELVLQIERNGQLMFVTCQID